MNRFPRVVVGEGEEDEDVDQEEEERSSNVPPRASTPNRSANVIVIQGEQEEDCEEDDESDLPTSSPPNRAPVIVDGEDVEDDDFEEDEFKPIDPFSSPISENQQLLASPLIPNVPSNFNPSSPVNPAPISSSANIFSKREEGESAEEIDLPDESPLSYLSSQSSSSTARSTTTSTTSTSGSPLSLTNPLSPTTSTVSTSSLSSYSASRGSSGNAPGGSLKSSGTKNIKIISEPIPTTESGRQLRNLNQRVRKEVGERIAAQYQSVTKNIRTLETDLKTTLSSVQDITFHTREAIQDLSTIQGDLTVLIHVLSSLPPLSQRSQ